MSEQSLGVAVYMGHLARVQMLLAGGADPDEPWGTGTPLMAVVDEPSEFFDGDALRIAEVLLDAGAAVTPAMPMGRRRCTPPHVRRQQLRSCSGEAEIPTFEH